MAVVTVAVLTAAAVHGKGSTVVLRLGNHALSVSLTHHDDDDHDAGSSSSSAEPSSLPCQASGYCSLGKSKVWTGDVATNEALREMLEAVSFKKEVSWR